MRHEGFHSVSLEPRVLCYQAIRDQLKICRRLRFASLLAKELI